MELNLPYYAFTYMLFFPLVGSIVALAIQPRARLAYLINILVAMLALYFVAGSSPTPEVFVWFRFFDAIPLAFSQDGLMAQFSVYVIFMWLITLVYCYGYRQYHHVHRDIKMLVFINLSILATLWICLSANPMTLFVGYELLTLFSFPLLMIKSTEESYKAARTYLATLLSSSVALFLPAVIVMYYYSYVNAVFNLKGVISNIAPNWAITLIIFGSLFGVAKAALWPLNRWLPQAMVAPIPVSGLLHAVAVVKSGILVLIKILLYGIGITRMQEWAAANPFLYGLLWLVPAITILHASIKAIKSEDLKQILAYSTIAQLSYIILTILILTPLSVAIAFIHLIGHGFAKICLFFAAGSLLNMGQKYSLKNFANVYSARPYIVICFIIASMSIVGVPPFIGFVSKYKILTESFLTNNYHIVFLLVAAAIFNIIYFSKVIATFLQKTNNSDRELPKLPQEMALAIYLTAALTIVSLIAVPNLLPNFIE